MSMWEIELETLQDIRSSASHTLKTLIDFVIPTTVTLRLRLQVMIKVCISSVGQVTL